MSEYRRLFVKGDMYFFTVVTYDRQPLLCEEPALIRLKDALRYIWDKHASRIEGLVICRIISSFIMSLNGFAKNSSHQSGYNSHRLYRRKPFLYSSNFGAS